MSICYNEERKQFVIETEKFGYVFYVFEGILRHLYWGKKLISYSDLPQLDRINNFISATYLELPQYNSEFCGWGGKFFHEPTLKLTFGDGVRDLCLQYLCHTISDDGNLLTVTLKDKSYNLTVDLFYRIYDGLDIIDRNCVIHNNTGETVTLIKASSATVSMPFSEKEYTLTSFGSAWAHEYEICKTPVTKAKTVLESRAGISNATNYPYFAIDQGDADENSGVVWFGTLQWSGNWNISVELDTKHLTRITGGISDFDFTYRLKDGESFTTPKFSFGCTDCGFSGASRQFHDYIREVIAPKAWAHKVLPVIYNTWTSYEFNINEKNCMKLAETAAKIGAELFVIDDGWFGKRNDAKSSLGDWDPSTEKFPNGLKPLIDKVNGLGMMFGIWVEPEMVNPDSALYRQHPDWVINFPGRERTLSRNQLILNLARNDVYDFIISFLDDLLENNNIGYLKWDMNRWFSQPGWPEVAAEEQQSMWVKYVWNFYRIFEHLNKKYPDLIVENCASGGLRADLAMSQYCSRINRSDNQDPYDELLLHEGFTYVNLPRSAGGAGHISANYSGINKRNCSMKFKAHVGYMGSLGIGVDFSKMSEDEIAELKGYVTEYKKIRHIVQLGDMYRLHSVRNEDYSAFQFVTKDKSEALLFVFCPNSKFCNPYPEIKLFGLDPNKRYSVNGEYSSLGDTLMKYGVRGEHHTIGNMSSKMFYIKSE